MRKFDMKKFNTPYWPDSINKTVLSFNYDIRNEKKTDCKILYSSIKILDHIFLYLF